ncbi:MAG TPA: M28 family peptidase, partial [Blastocatellia bacterium]|nr:M28 family peptidase [Blastocatellia bacterium]
MKHRRSSRRALAVFLAALFLAAPTAAANLPLPAPEATSSITGRDLKKHLSFLASDELGGRYTLSPSIRIAARYLASELESYGYRGGARDGSFFQKVPLSFRSVDMTRSGLTLTVAGAKQELKYADDFATQTPTNLDLSGDLVFVGYGISSPGNNHDDYAGLDVKGKIVVAVSGIPSTLRGMRIGLEEQGIAAAQSRGAVAAIFIESQYLAQWGLVKSYIQRESPSLPPMPTSSGAAFPSFLAGPGLVKAIAKAMNKDESYLTGTAGSPLKPAAIPASAALKMAVTVKDAPPTFNVVGILEGSDPKLKNEYVVFSAHYDHLQTNRNGEVYNGADDDGSGTAGVLEIAQAFSVGPRSPRSILIIFHTGEEMGLLGSLYNTDYEPIVPLKNLVANFNIDMIGRSRQDGNNDPRDRELTDKDSVYVIGADKLSSELHKISEDTNAATARMKLDYTYNDETHPQRFYYRSDHYNYAKHGIPVI